jgi:hypothetical protein
LRSSIRDEDKKEQWKNLKKMENKKERKKERKKKRKIVVVEETGHRYARINNKACNVRITFRHVRATIIAVETQWVLHNMNVCL